jgi:hypothetical protein
LFFFFQIKSISHTLDCTQKKEREKEAERKDDKSTILYVLESNTKKEKP